MANNDSSGVKSGVSLTVDSIEWTMEAHDVGGKVQDGSEKSDYIDDLIGDNDSVSTQDQRGYYTQDGNQGALTVNSKAHAASHASTVSLKSFDIHEEGHCRLNAEGLEKRRSKSEGCCCIQ